MKIFAVSDLHLSGDCPKPMNIFGQDWENHWEKIQDDWRSQVGENDLVLIGGDISWAMTLEQAKVDLDQIQALPGKKVLLRGNHDYWWGSLSKVAAAMGPSCCPLQNNALRYGRCLVAGSRGWTVPGTNTDGQDKKIYARELQRLQLSLDQAKKMRKEEDMLIVMTHFPPFNERQEPSEVTALLESYQVDYVIYGHLHGYYQRHAFDGELRGIPYQLTSCDHLGFSIFQIVELEE